MALLLNEEQSMLRDSARSFLAENAPVAQLRQLRDSLDPAGFSGPTWTRFCELGFAGVAVPESAILLPQKWTSVAASPVFAVASTWTSSH